MLMLGLSNLRIKTMRLGCEDMLRLAVKIWMKRAAPKLVRLEAVEESELSSAFWKSWALQGINYLG